MKTDESGQISAELILLIAGIMMIVLLAMSLYNEYLSDFSSSIHDNEVKDITLKLDKINSLLE